MWTIYISKKWCTLVAQEKRVFLAILAHSGPKVGNLIRGRRCAAPKASWAAILTHVVGEVPICHKVPRTAQGPHKERTGTPLKGAFGDFGCFSHFGYFAPWPGRPGAKAKKVADRLFGTATVR